MTNKVAIELKGVTKTFGNVIANNNIDLKAKYGEILALLGENGSGKTTLMNILAGIYRPDSGQIFIDGKPARINSPSDAIERGIGMIFQHFKLVNVFSAEQNILLGSKKKRAPGKNKNKNKNISELLNTYGFKIDLKKKIYNMSVGEKQTVEVLKVLYRGAKILILDEPTAVLTPQEIGRLFDVLRKMKENGAAIIIITHKLNEVMEISDYAAILRRGESVGVVETREANEKSLAEKMVGKTLNLSIERPRVFPNNPVLEVENLRGERLKNVSFELKTGEILGVAALAGAGQKELCETIAGLAKPKSGVVKLGGLDITRKKPIEISNLGIGLAFVPEDRLGMGLVGSMSLTDNMMIKNYNRRRGFFIDRAPARALAVRLIKELDIQTPGPEIPIKILSGGNIQKALLGREIESKPRVLIVSYPVRGLDINSSFTIYNLINKQKKEGAAILFVGEDLDVLMEISDRIMVLSDGEVTGILDNENITKEQLGLLMTGTKVC
jgi:simple sugar transport system ATP-binding protein